MKFNIDTSARFGVEIEGYFPERYPSGNIDWAHYEARGWNRKSEYLSPSHVRKGGRTLYGGEITSPPLRGLPGLVEVEGALDTFKRAGFAIGAGAGLHVHHEAQGWTPDNFRSLINLSIAIGWGLKYLVAKSRRDNRFCSFNVTNQAVDNLISWNQNPNQFLGQRLEQQVARRCFMRERFSFINLDAYWAHGTVEFRCHEATTNATTMKRWIELTQLIMRAAQSRDYTFSPATLKRRVGNNMGGQPVWTDGESRRRKVSRLCTIKHLYYLLALSGQEINPESVRFYERKRRVF